MNQETALPQVPSFTDEEFIAFLEEAGFWVDNLVADETEGTGTVTPTAQPLAF